MFNSGSVFFKFTVCLYLFPQSRWTRTELNPFRKSQTVVSWWSDCNGHTVSAACRVNSSGGIRLDDKLPDNLIQLVNFQSHAVEVGPIVAAYILASV